MSSHVDEPPITVHSNSGAITVEQSASTGLRVLIDPRRRSGYNEFSLAEEIESTVSAYRNELVGKTKQFIQKREVECRPTPKARELAHKAKYDLAVEELTSEGKSASGTVEAIVSGDGDLFIKFNGNVVRRTDISTSDLEIEINQAISSACKAFSRRAREIRRSLNALLLCWLTVQKWLASADGYVFTANIRGKLLLQKV